MERIRIYALTLLLTIVAVVAQAQPTSLPGSTGQTDARVLNIWGSMYTGAANASWSDWNGGSTIEATTIGGVKKITFNNAYDNRGWAGLVFDGNKQDVNTCSHLNVWVWADVQTTIGLEFQSDYSTQEGGDANYDKYKSVLTLPVSANTWTKVSVALSDMPLKGGDNRHGYLNDIKNISIVQSYSDNTNHTIYVSDVYFSEETNDVTHYLVNGQNYRLFEADATWYVMHDFFSRNNDGTYTFNAIDGYYRLVRDAGKKFVKVEPMNDNGTAESDYDITTGQGAIWLRGNLFGFPSHSDSNGWAPDRRFAMAEVDDKVYQTTMTIGTELATKYDDGAQFKLFRLYSGWSDDSDNTKAYDFKPNNSVNGEKISFVSGAHHIFQIPDATGNIGPKGNVTLRTGDEWQFEAKVIDNNNLSFSANRVWLNTGDLQPASAPTDASDKVLSVFSDTYDTNLGMKMSGYSHVVNWGQSKKHQYTTNEPDHRSIDYRTYADDSNDQVAVFEFKVDDSDVHREWLNLHFPAQNLSEYKYLHLDVNDLDGLNSEIYIWPRKTNDMPAFDTNTQSVPALKFSLLKDRDANGWKSIDVPLSAILGLDGSTDLTSIDHIGIQAVGGVKGALAIDNVYFTKEKKTFTTYDNDERGIDWNTATGTTCYVDQIVWTKSGPTAGVNIVDTYNDNWAKIHDGDVHSYFQFNHDDTNSENEHSQILIQLKDDIRVSDVEVIWANGYASQYDVYAFESYPVVDGEIPSSKLTDENLLYSIGKDEPIQMDHEPYYVIKSELKEKVTHNSRYILLDLKKRGNGDTFGYYIDEVHVGAYDEDYDKPHHLNFPVTVIQTELPPTELKVTVRNKRNAVLSEWTSKIVPGSVKTTWDSPLLKNDNNRQTWVYATAPGNFDVTVTGSVEGVDNLNEGKSTVKVSKNWKPKKLKAGTEDEWEDGDWKSLVQPIAASVVAGSGTDAQKQELLDGKIKASHSEIWDNRTYYPYKSADGTEATNDHSRWSSAYANPDENHPENQWWMIDLNPQTTQQSNSFSLFAATDKVYELTDVEIVWERAIAGEYSVYGFTEEPSAEDLARDYDAFMTKYGDHLVYTHKMSNILEYPYHDQHTNNSQAGAIEEDNRTRYMLIRTKNAQATPYYNGTSISFWEVYAWGADVTVTDNVTKLKTDNLSVKAGHEGVVDVTAYGGTELEGQYQYEESEWHPVEFSVPATSKYVLINIPDEDKEGSTGKTVDRFFFFEKVNDYTEEQQYKQAYENETIKPLAYIVDNDNGTYGVKVMPGIKGLGQTKDDYDNDNGATDTKSITINMESTNTLGTTIKGQFELVIYKDAMALLTDGTSSNKRQVYDDGYYSESVLKSNITAETVTIDLRNVDFSYDNAGTALNHSVLPAPHTVTKGEGASKVQLNPNTIYYTDEPYTDESTGTISGGNLAFRQGEVWRVPVLRIFDGWDWEPITNEGGMIAASASFYTSIPANHYSFIALPFAPDISYFSSKNIKLYKPTAFRPERNAVKIDEISEFGSDEIGHPLVIYTENANNYRENGYAVVFKSAGTQTSVNPFPGKWENNGATIIPSYTKQTLAASDESFDYYLYSIKNDQFMQVGSEALADDLWNGNEEEDEQGSGDQPHLSASQVMPFYAYMKVPKQASPAPAFTFMLTDDTETTGIDNATAETDENVEVYDVQGRYVGNCVRTHLTPGIYIVKKADGSTRKVYIRK